MNRLFSLNKKNPIAISSHVPIENAFSMFNFKPSNQPQQEMA
jgi:hypothetical protein